MSIWLERFLRRGWRFVPFKAGGDNSGRRRKIRCPQPGCGLCLTVDTSAAVTKSADAVESVVELSMVLANRRNRLGLTSDDIDHCAGLGARHVHVPDHGPQRECGDQQQALPAFAHGQGGQQRDGHGRTPDQHQRPAQCG